MYKMVKYPLDFAVYKIGSPTPNNMSLVQEQKETHQDHNKIFQSILIFSRTKTVEKKNSERCLTRIEAG